MILSPIGGPPVYNFVVEARRLGWRNSSLVASPELLRTSMETRLGKSIFDFHPQLYNPHAPRPPGFPHTTSHIGPSPPPTRLSHARSVLLPFCSPWRAPPFLANRQRRWRDRKNTRTPSFRNRKLSRTNIRTLLLPNAFPGLRYSVHLVSART